MTVTLRDLAKMIDHSLLHPTMTVDPERLQTRRQYGVATACIKPYAVKQAAKCWPVRVLVGP